MKTLFHIMTVRLRRTFVLSALLMSIVGSAQAVVAPSYNGDFNSIAVAGVNTLNFNQGAGTDRILIVRALYESGLANPLVPFATFNSLPMTLLRSDDASGLGAHVFYLVNPPVGNFPVVVTAGGGGRTRIEAFSYSNVDQTTPIGARNGANGTDGSAPYVATVPFTPTNTNSRVVQVNWWQGGAGGGGYSLGNGTARASSAFGMWQWHSSGFGDWIPPSTAPVNLTQSWTAGGTQWTAQAFELMPVSLPAGPITLTKSASAATVTIGDTLTYCFAWSNGDNKSNPITIWDTVSSAITYQGCNTGCTRSGSLVRWNLGSQAAFSSGNVCFWGIVTGYP